MVPDGPPPDGADPSCVLFLAATGDQGYQRRLNLGAPLMKQVGRVCVPGCVPGGLYCIGTFEALHSYD